MLQRSGYLIQQRFNRYFFPTILMSVALSLSMVLDGIIVGHLLDAQAFATVNLGLPLMQFYAALFVLFGMGGSILAAACLGQQQQEKAGAVLTLSTLSLLVVGLVCMVFGLVFIDEISTLSSGNDPALAARFRQFVEPLIIAAPLILLVPGLSYFVRTDAQPTLASAVLIVANIVNPLCCVLFIHWLGDIRAVGWAYVVGYGAGFLVLLRYFCSSQRSLRFSCKGINKSLFSQLFTTGLPGGVNIGLLFVKLLCLNLLVIAVAGSNGMVALSVCLACLSLVSMGISGASQTMMPIIGVLYGERDYGGIRIVFRRAFTILLVATSLLVAALMIYPQGFLALFGVNQGEQQDIASHAIRFFAPSLFGDAFAMLMIYYAQTIQRAQIAVVASVTQTVAVIIPTAWLLSRWWGLDGIWLAFNCAAIVSMLVILVMHRRSAQHSQPKLSHLLLLPTQSPTPLLDVSIKNRVEDAVQLSIAVGEFCLEHHVEANLAQKASLIVEEIAVNIVRYSGKPVAASTIDLRVSIGPDRLSLSFRDEGLAFNPLQQTSTAPCGLTIVRATQAQISYNYALGFNNSRITLMR